MSKKEKQIYTKGVTDTILVITEFSFFSYMLTQVLIKICY